MKSENFVRQSSLEGNYLNVPLQEPVQLDEIVIKVVKQDCPEFLIPFRIVEINDSMSLRYKLTDMIALEYTDRTLHKAKFIRLYKNLLAPFMKGNDWFLDYHNLCIDSKYIFLDKMNTLAHFIYIPEHSCRNTDEEILQFFKDTFVQITITDDASFQVRLFQYFTKADVTLSDLYRMISEEDRKLGSAEKVPAADVSRASVQNKASGDGHPLVNGNPARPKLNVKTDTVQEKIEPASQALSDSHDGEDEVMQALFGNNKKKEKEKGKSQKKEKERKAAGFGFFGKKNEQSGGRKAEENYQKEQKPFSSGADSANSINPFEESLPMYMPDENDKTEIISDGFHLKPYLELIESSLTGALSRIELDFNNRYITIGRSSSDESQPDVAFSREFTQISRRHARIEKREDSYYVIDLGSTNHTVLNGQILMPNQPYQLTDGGELAFSDSKPIRYKIHL